MAVKAARIREYLLGRIEEGNLSPGDRLPSRLDLEKRFGCARATIDRALGELKREGVIRAELGRGTFVAEPANRKSRVDGPAVVLPESDLRIQGELFVFGIHRELTRGLTDRGLAPHDTMEEPIRVGGPEWDRLARVRMLFWVRPSPASEPAMRALARKKVPQVLLNRDYGPYPCIVTDAVEGQRKAVAFLADRGHERIGYVHPPNRPLTYFDTQRMVGFLEGVHRRGIAPDAAPRFEMSFVRSAHAEERLASWLSSPEAPTAVILAAAQAGAMMRAASLAGKRVPDDISVLTIDEVHDPTGMAGLTFTCMRQRFAEIGRRAADLDPNDLRRDGGLLKIKLVPDLVEGDSVVRRARGRK